MVDIIENHGESTDWGMCFSPSHNEIEIVRNLIHECGWREVVALFAHEMVHVCQWYILTKNVKTTADWNSAVRKWQSDDMEKLANAVQDFVLCLLLKRQGSESRQGAHKSNHMEV